MPTMCRTVTEAIETVYTEQVDTWVNTQRQKCGRVVWYKPWTWMCWLFWVLVKIVTFVVYAVINFVTSVICYVVSWVLYVVLVVVGWVANLWCQNCWIHEWANLHLGEGIGNCKLVGERTPAKDKPDHYVYVFKCKCTSDGKAVTITVTALNDDIAAEMARGEILKKCEFIPEIALTDAELNLDGSATTTYTFRCTCRNGGFASDIVVVQPTLSPTSLKDAKKEAKRRCKESCA